jgi:hypothetical protein
MRARLRRNSSRSRLRRAATPFQVNPRACREQTIAEYSIRYKGFPYCLFPLSMWVRCLVTRRMKAKLSELAMQCQKQSSGEFVRAASRALATNARNHSFPEKFEKGDLDQDENANADQPSLDLYRAHRHSDMIVRAAWPAVERRREESPNKEPTLRHWRLPNAPSISGSALTAEYQPRDGRLSRIAKSF